jgi:flagellar biosynthesis protein FlhF
MMKIRKFLAPSIPEALRQIKHEMGEDALILGTSRKRRLDESGNRVEVVAAAGSQTDSTGGRAHNPTTNNVTANKELVTMRTIEKDIVNELKQIEARLKDILETLVVPSAKPTQEIGGAMNLNLLDAGFDRSVIASRLAPSIQRGTTLDGMLKGLLSGLSIEEPRDRIAVFVGPSGAGKSTTILKMASRRTWPERAKPRVVFFGEDSRRDTAWLGAECKRLGVKFSKVTKVNKLEKMITKERKRPILIDTPSISDLREEHLRFLIDMSRRTDGMRIRLVIDSTMDPLNICAIASCVPAGAPMGLVLTKLDEATRIGGAVSAAISAGIPLAYVTGGRNITDGIFVPDTDLLSEKILESVRAA